MLLIRPAVVVGVTRGHGCGRAAVPEFSSGEKQASPRGEEAAGGAVVREAGFVGRFVSKAVRVFGRRGIENTSLSVKEETFARRREGVSSNRRRPAAGAGRRPRRSRMSRRRRKCAYL